MDNVAIISTNKNKYSETFIHNHVKLLPLPIHFLFGGYLPTLYSQDKGQTTFPIVRNKKWFALKKEPIYEKEKLTAAIEAYLIKHKIKLILCEYGPSGVELMRSAKKLSIPLIVHFHGYDAYRDDILSSYGKQYKELFSIATQIIGVSKHMCNQLITLGCSEAKLNYLPYGIDTGIFKFSGNERKEIIFISCGRFVEKKAPHITIKAFEKVYRQRNDARLIMIGDGELLKYSADLVNQLGIHHAVEFKGALGQKEIASLYSKSFAFLQHSITTRTNDSEGTPLSVMEAMATGLPVVATTHTGINDIITNEGLGYLVEEKNSDEMAEKMLYLVKNSATATEIGQRASEHIHKNYTLDIYTKKLSDLIRQSIPQSIKK